jgi:hypothetical protein
MRYDECYLFATVVGRYCSGARVYHYEGRLSDKQFTTCEKHRLKGNRMTGRHLLVRRISHRTD